MDTTTCTDPGTLLKVGWNDANEWQRHTIVSTPGIYNLYIRYASGAAGGQLSVMINSNNVSGTVTLPSTGSYTTYATYIVSNVTVTSSGPATVQINCITPGYDLAWVEFVPANGAPLPPIGEIVEGAQPGIPTGLTAGLVATAGNGEVSLIWVTSESATSYNVYRATTSGGSYTMISTPSSVTAPSYLDAGLTNGTTYYYMVTGVNANGEGAASIEANVTPLATSLPNLWMDQDVGVATLWSGDAGDVGWPGSASYAAGTYTVTGSGIDVWNNADSFHYTYRGVSGDCTNIVQVTSLQNSDPWAKAGLMIRETLNQDSVNAFVTITSQNGSLFSTRTTTGATSSSSAGSGTAPYWVRLVRIGNVFTAYSSSNGSSWSQIGSAVTIPMATNVFVGLAVTAHNNTRTNIATFNNLNLTFQLPSVPASLNATSSVAQIALTWPASPNATSYNLYRSTTNGGLYTLTASGIMTTNFSDLAVTNGASYYYVVTSVNWNGESSNSIQAAATMPLPDITANYSTNSIILTWPSTASAFNLYSTTNLSPPIVWSPVSNVITNQDGTFSASSSMDNPCQFFQLRAP